MWRFDSESGPQMSIPPEERVAFLKTLLSDEYWQFQRLNIEKLIQMYESGELGPLCPGKTTYIRNGEVMDRPARISAKFRLPLSNEPHRWIQASISNDTGSSQQVIFEEDLIALGWDSVTYPGRLGLATVTTASGVLRRLRVLIEMQIVDSNGVAMTPWFEETAIVAFARGSLPRLSGLRMRDHLYFATAPGNETLYVAAKKKWYCQSTASDVNRKQQEMCWTCTDNDHL
ncbi:hypothetical protein PRK78_005631 [Emydomyces testavorans]|uniref:Uncharacterized protein n=1 Tax=Emydomyces testavorans TaxID=2070801 RepID=A0AAF0IKW6_9EURO|nr:hypothetical protein PRK78_005631 [Emydomyces testavorans]